MLRFLAFHLKVNLHFGRSITHSVIKGPISLLGTQILSINKCEEDDRNNACGEKCRVICDMSSTKNR